MTTTPIPPIMSVARFERFFRAAAGLDVDKNDLRRFSEFVDHKVYDLLISARNTAKANARDVIEPHDLPITKGLQENIQAFRRMNEDLELQPILDRLTSRPQIGTAYSAETEAELPRIVGGLSVALARSFKVLDPELRNPSTEHWERSFRLFDLLL